jgi:hypothetical protein
MVAATGVGETGRMGLVRAVGVWGLVVGLLLPLEARPCSPSPTESWTRRWGAVEVSVTPTGPGSPRRAERSHLIVRVKGKALWSRDLPAFYFSGAVFPSADGRLLALVDRGEEALIFLDRGAELARWKPLELLRPSERKGFSYSTCGWRWFTTARWEGTTLVAELPIHGVVPPIYAQPEGLQVRYDVRTGKATRPPTPPPAPVASLLARYQAEPTDAALSALARRSLDEAKPQPELAAFWLGYLRESPSRIDEAMEAFAVVASNEDLHRAVELPPDPKRDLALLQLLETRSPEDAARLAWAALSEKREPELLRTRAVVFLTRKGRARTRALEAVKLGLADPGASVREESARQTPGVASPLKAFEWVAPLLNDADESVRASASGALLSVLQAGGAAGPELVLRLQRLERTTGPRVFPEGTFVLATVAHARKDLPRARTLYRRAAEALAKVGGRRAWMAGKLRVEAQVQLALMDRKAGANEEARALVRAVRADDRHRQDYVCAPKPGEFSTLVLPEPPCGARYTAEGVLDRAFGRR